MANILGYFARHKAVAIIDIVVFIVLIGNFVFVPSNHIWNIIFAFIAIMQYVQTFLDIKHESDDDDNE